MVVPFPYELGLSRSILANKFAFAGGASGTTITVRGVKPGYSCFASIQSQTTGGVSVTTVTPSIDTLSITFTADPGASVIVFYVVKTDSTI